MSLIHLEYSMAFIQILIEYDMKQQEYKIN